MLEARVYPKARRKRTECVKSEQTQREERGAGRGKWGAEESKGEKRSPCVYRMRVLRVFNLEMDRPRMRLYETS